MTKMNNQRKIHQQPVFDSTGLLPKKNWKTVLLHIALLVVVVFLTEISAAKADMVFDFQMKLAKKGNAEAQFKVGEMYEAGRGVEKNMVEAKRWINKAAAQGNKAAGYNLLYKDLENNGVTKDNKARLADLQKAANSGDGYAQYYIGLMYSRGVGVKKNYDSAHDWLSKASLVGVTAAEAEMANVNQASHKAQQRAQQQAAQQQAAQQQAARRKQEELRKLEAQRQQQDAAAKKKADQEQQLARQREAERMAAEEARKQRLIAEKEAEAERKRQAVLAQRKQKEAEKQTQFESDPCQGKSARFLSTCR
jgi:flagellar biosynthesis GTPase FlhF